MNAPQLPQAFLFGTGHGELIVVFVVVLLLFGPRKLPEMARMIGKILSQLRNASNDFREQVMHIEEDEPAARPKSESKADSVDAMDVVSEDVDVGKVEKEEDPDSDGTPAG